MPDEKKGAPRLGNAPQNADKDSTNNNKQRNHDSSGDLPFVLLWRRAVLNHGTFKASALLALFVIAEFADPYEGSGAEPSIATIVRLARMKDQTVLNAITQAKAARFLAVTKYRGGDGRDWRKQTYTLLIPASANTNSARKQAHLDRVRAKRDVTRSGGDVTQSGGDVTSPLSQDDVTQSGGTILESSSYLERHSDIEVIQDADSSSSSIYKKQIPRASTRGIYLFDVWECLGGDPGELAAAIQQHGAATLFSVMGAMYKAGTPAALLKDWLEPA